VVAQRLRERVVLVLRAGEPGDAVEQQGVVVARGQSRDLGAGPVQQDGAEPSDLAVDADGLLCGHGPRLGAGPDTRKSRSMVAN